MFRRHLPAIVLATMLVVAVAGVQSAIGADANDWTSSLKTGDVVARGTVWKVTVTPTPDRVEFWASGQMIGTDTSEPFEVPLDLPAGDHKIGFCHRKDGVQKCETTEPGTGIVARIKVVEPAPTSSGSTSTTQPSSTSAPTSETTTSTATGQTSPATATRSDSVAPKPVRRVDVAGADTSSVKVQWPKSRDNVGVAGYGVFVNGKTTGTTPELWYSVGGLACGTGYTLGVDVFDVAGNHSSQTSTTVSTSACADLVPPSVPTGIKLAAATGSTVVLAWLPSTDNVGVVGYGLYVGGLRVGSTSEATATLSGLACGRSYEIGIDAVDAAGNRSARASSYFSTSACVDSQAPSTPTGLATSATTTSVTLSWSASTDNVGVAGYGVYRSSNRVATTTQTTTTFSGLTCGTSYTLGVDAFDVAGNRSTVASMATSTLPCDPPADDWTSSLKTGDVVPRGTVWQVTVTPTPDAVEFWASGQEIGTDTTAPFETPLNLPAGDQTIGFCHRKDGVQQCETTEPGTGIVARITLVDQSAPSGDTSAPTVPGSLRVDSSGPTSVDLAWAASTDNTGVAGYGLYRGTTLIGTASATNATFVSLTCGTAYQLGVDAYDAAGNRSPRADITVTTSACSDTQAPTVPANVVVGTRTATSVALSWSPSSDNLGVVGYGLYRGGSRVSTTTGTTGIVSGLTCGTSYTLGVDAYDAAGNRSAQAVVMVATTACTDTQPPTAPTGLATSNVTQTGMTVSWAASTDNVGVTGYDVYRNGTKVGSTASLTYVLSSLTCNTAYTLGVVAYDAAGNRSTQTQSGATTAACSTSPTGAQVVVSPNGNDSNACTPTAPCRSLVRGYQVAQSGNTIEVDGGTYTTSESQNRLSGSKTVTLRVPSGEVAGFTSRVVLDGLQNATIYGPFSTKPAYNHNQDIKDFSVDGCSNNLNLYDIRAGLFDVTGSADNISFYGGDFGGYSDTNQEDSWVGGDGSSCGDGGIVSNLLFDGIYLHDVLFVSGSQWGDSHPDCLQTGGLLDRMTIRNSRIMRCGNSFFGFYGDFGNFTNIVIENNVFYGIKDSYWGFNIDPKSRSCSITVRYNTYDPDNPVNPGYAYSPPSILCQTRQVYGNIFRKGEPGGCNGSGWSFNVFELGDACGSNASVGQVSFVSRGSDYHLNSGAFAIGKGDPSRYPSTDVDGQARSSPPDAGFDER